MRPSSIQDFRISGIVNGSEVSLQLPKAVAGINRTLVDTIK